MQLITQLRYEKYECFNLFRVAIKPDLLMRIREPNGYRTFYANPGLKTGVSQCLFWVVLNPRALFPAAPDLSPALPSQGRVTFPFVFTGNEIASCRLQNFPPYKICVKKTKGAAQFDYSNNRIPSATSILPR